MKNESDLQIEKKKVRGRSGSLMKRFKFRGRRNSTAESSSETAQNPKDSERSLSVQKSASETNLTEVSWKSAENLVPEDPTNSAPGAIDVESGQSCAANTQESPPESIKSLEDLKHMPTYGELVLDPSVETSTPTSTNARPKDHLYKILVIGDLGTGKTSIIKRYVHQFFSQHYRATIGVDFALKVVNWDDNMIVRLQLWDIAGQERYGNMTRVYYKEAVGAFIVFDVTRVPTFESVANWKADLDSKVQLPDGSPIPCVLLANKCDQQKEGIVNNKTKMDEYCKEKGFADWFETSAKENINIEEAARCLIQKILLNASIINNCDNKDKEQFALTNDSNVQKGVRKLCSC